MSPPRAVPHLCRLCGRAARDTRDRLQDAGWFTYRGKWPAARQVCPGCVRDRKAEVKQLWEEACRGMVEGMGEGE